MPSSIPTQRLSSHIENSKQSIETELHEIHVLLKYTVSLESLHGVLSHLESAAVLLKSEDHSKNFLIQTYTSVIPHNTNIQSQQFKSTKRKKKRVAYSTLRKLTLEESPPVD